MDPAYVALQRGRILGGGIRRNRSAVRAEREAADLVRRERCNQPLRRVRIVQNVGHLSLPRVISG